MISTQTKEVKIEPIVYIIESASIEDYHSNRKEGEILRRSLDMMNIKNYYYPVISRAGFEYILKNINIPYVDGDIIKIPVLHISAHGNEKGFILMNKDFIDWKDFRNLLGPINNKCMQILTICLSVCCGAYAIAAARTIDIRECPFLYLVGAEKEISWDDSMLAFQIFYHLFDRFVKGEIKNVRDIMNNVTINSPFEIINGIEEQKEYKKRIASIVDFLRHKK